MRRVFFFWAAVVVAGAGVFLAAPGAGGEECTLQLKRLGSRSVYTMTDYQFRATYPQSFHRQFLDPSLSGRMRVQIGGLENQDAAFKRIVKKEPAKYECKHPFRGVAKLGTQEFAFVFDAVGAKPDEPQAKDKAKEQEKARAAKEKAKADKAKEKPKAKSSLLESLSKAVTTEVTVPGADEPRQPGKAIVYNRLYFDLNHNGDLTDDKVIESEPSGRMFAASGNYARAQFPMVTVTLEADGTKFDYAFTVDVTYQAMDARMEYAWASLNAAAYREGEITLDGKKRRVAIVDFNSNGRFDDAIKLRDDMRGRNEEVYPAFGDVLLLDPQADSPVYLNPYDVTSSGNRYHVSKLVNIEEKFYHLKTSPAGDKLSLTSATPALGYVTNPNEGFTAVVYSDQGFLKIRGGKSKPAPLPEGSWKLLSYSIDQADTPAPEKPADEKKEEAASGTKGKESKKSGGLLSAVLQTLVGGVASSSPVGRPRLTRVSAQATGSYKPVTVRKGETVALAFGPPYKPVVKVDYPSGTGQVRLGMTLVGSAGERCTDMMVRGDRPSKPQFTIRDPKGEVVHRGSFEYG